MDAVLDAESRTQTMPPTEVPMLSKKLTVAENTHRRLIRPNGSAESAVGRLQGRFKDLHNSPFTTAHIVRRCAMEFQAFQHQGRSRNQQRTFVLACFGAEYDDRPEALAGPNRESRPADVDRLADKRPIPADFDRVAAVGGLHCRGEGVELLLRDALAAHDDEGARLRIRRL